jgi:hypothetical protein
MVQGLFRDFEGAAGLIRRNRRYERKGLLYGRRDLEGDVTVSVC